ncbi:GNAT family N-acetyltransferase [Nocardiopsis oceani]
MTLLHTGLDLPGPVVARVATAGDHTALRSLWLLFRHHMSGFNAALPSADGTYRSDRLDYALSPEYPAWQAWILTAGEHPIGFAVTRALDQPVRVLNSFFLVAPARRGGLGTQFARAVVSAAPGEWAVAYQETNRAAAAFWARVAAECAPEWRRDRHPVPGRPDLPPDTWNVFTSG